MRLLDLAPKLGVTPAYVSSLENGHKQPNLALIAKYAEVFVTSRARILAFSEDLASTRPMNVPKIRRSLVMMMETLGYV